MTVDGFPELNGDIQLGDMVFNTVDADDTLWIISDLEGWWTLPEPEFEDYPFNLGDGSYQASGRYASRIINMNGVFIPSSPGNLALARRKLARAVNLCRQSAWLTTHAPDYTRGSIVTLSGQPLIETTAITGRTTFSIGLKAADPVKYSLNGNVPPGLYEVTQTGGGVFTVTNEGDYPVNPTITLFGGLVTSSSLTNHTTGEVMHLAKAVLDGESLVLNTKTRSVSLDGAPNKRGYLTWDTGWIDLQPGDNELELISIGSGGVTVTYRHGWIS